MKIESFSIELITEHCKKKNDCLLLELADRAACESAKSSIYRYGKMHGITFTCKTIENTNVLVTRTN